MEQNLELVMFARVALHLGNEKKKSGTFQLFYTDQSFLLIKVFFLKN